jgi:Uma2 family endonuclease
MPATHRYYPKRWTAYDDRALMEASPTHWPRYETIDGDLLVTPAPRTVHQEALELLRDVLKPYIARHSLGRLWGAPADIELEKDTLVQPDLFVIPASLGKPRRWRDITSLLLAIEVLSPSSRRHDRVTKRRFFQRVAVPEYWTVDLERQLIERWRPHLDAPEILGQQMPWHPPDAGEPLSIDLVAFFAEIES